MKEYYVYVYLDPRKIGKYQYGNLQFDHEPFYIGKGKKERCYRGILDRKKSLKVSKIKSIITAGLYPIILKLYENLTNNESITLEIDCIYKIGRSQFGNGPLTNMTPGGDGGSGYHSEEFKAKLRKPVIQYNEEGDVMEYPSVSDASQKTGIKGQNISAAINGRYKQAGGYKWRYKDPSDLNKHRKKYKKPHSDLTKEKMKNSSKKGLEHHMSGKFGKNNITSKKVSQKTLDGDTVKIWDSLMDIKRELGFSPSNISKCCKGKVKTIGGYTWKFYL